ncbi:hypothetical protein [Natronolimnobius baerhuensis]|uniref:Uncharacterized protein n=1 Tax=Natronolimnobius baerhuensis TaxID=253108 RepID=A0A202ECN4_9EURY|nr:hypothetical protein B2G88_04365 [Natronolimnobius baerhuensis]
MIGLTVAKKAATYGYKRYGIPGAVASGAIALAAYIGVRRALRSATDNADADVDVETLTQAVDEGSLEDVPGVGSERGNQ